MLHPRPDRALRHADRGLPQRRSPTAAPDHGQTGGEGHTPPAVSTPTRRHAHPQTSQARREQHRHTRRQHAHGRSGKRRGARRVRSTPGPEADALGAPPVQEGTALMTQTLRRLDDGTRYYSLTWRQWAAALTGGGLLYLAVRFSPLSQKWTFTAALLILATLAVAIMPLTGNALGLDRYLAAIVRWSLGPKHYSARATGRQRTARRRAAVDHPGDARRRGHGGPRRLGRARRQRRGPAMTAVAASTTRRARAPRRDGVHRRPHRHRRAGTRRPDRHHRRHLRARHRLRVRAQPDHRRPQRDRHDRSRLGQPVRRDPRPPGPGPVRADRPHPDRRRDGRRRRHGSPARSPTTSPPTRPAPTSPGHADASCTPNTSPSAPRRPASNPPSRRATGSPCHGAPRSPISERFKRACTPPKPEHRTSWQAHERAARDSLHYTEQIAGLLAGLGIDAHITGPVETLAVLWERLHPAARTLPDFDELHRVAQIVQATTPAAAAAHRQADPRRDHQRPRTRWHHRHRPALCCSTPTAPSRRRCTWAPCRRRPRHGGWRTCCRSRCPAPSPCTSPSATAAAPAPPNAAAGHACAPPSATRNAAASSSDQTKKTPSTRRSCLTANCGAPSPRPSMTSRPTSPFASWMATTSRSPNA